MNFENFTERARGFVQVAQDLAQGRGHQKLVPEHLLKALLDDEELNSQTLNDLKFALDELEIESVKKKPEGLVAQIAPLFKTLTKAEFKVKMAPSGKLVEVEVPAEFFEKLKETPGGNLLEGMFNKDSFKQMLTQAATTFPTTPVDQGDTWTNSFALDGPLGKQNVETKYSYEGEETVDGKVLDKIGLVIKMNFGKLENPMLAGATVKIKKQDSKGAMYFDNTRGQMASCP